MGLVELFVAVVLAGVSLLNAAVPLLAFGRARDPRLLGIACAHLGLAALGGLWAWGQLPYAPPPWTQADLPVLGLALAVALVFLATTLAPRRP